MSSSPRTSRLPPSPFVRLGALLNGLEPGLSPIALSVGEPQGPVPAFVAEILAREAAGFSKYPPIQGSDALRAAIAGWLTRRFSLPAGMIDADRMILAAEVHRLAACVASYIGALRYPQVHPYMGIMPGLKAFIAAVFGGIGSIQGAVIGGVALGFVEIMTVAFMPELSGYRDAFAFVLLVLVLLFKPTGLLGERMEEKI